MKSRNQILTLLHLFFLTFICATNPDNRLVPRSSTGYQRPEERIDQLPMFRGQRGPVPVPAGLPAASPYIWLAVHSAFNYFDIFSTTFWLLSLVISLALSTAGPGRGDHWKAAYVILALKNVFTVFLAVVESLISVQERIFPFIPAPLWIAFVLYMTLPVIVRRLDL